ncbi:MAG: GNAT family N-acetyltransferase [Chitinophagaceae bacterium]|nr:GNAT family N-acetyltransferase [Chitinophagaceae bacterium]
MINFKLLTFNELDNGLLYEILKLRNEIFIIEQNCHYLDLDDKDQKSFHLCGFDNEKLVAYCRILPEGVSYQNYCAIGRVLCHSDFRRKNYGILLMKKAIEICNEKFEEPIKLSGQKYLTQFYLNLGFEIVSEEYLEDDIPHFAFVLQKPNANIKN